MKQFGTRSYNHPKIEQPATYHSPTIPMARYLWYSRLFRSIENFRGMATIWDTTIAYARHRGHSLYKDNEVEI